MAQSLRPRATRWLQRSAAGGRPLPMRRLIGFIDPEAVSVSQILRRNERDLDYVSLSGRNRAGKFEREPSLPLRGTEGSNPACSRRESTANLTAEDVTSGVGDRASLRSARGRRQRPDPTTRRSGSTSGSSCHFRLPPQGGEEVMNERVDECLALAKDKFAPAVRPIYASTDTHRPIHVGSSIFLKINDVPHPRGRTVYESPQFTGDTPISMLLRPPGTLFH